MALVLINDMAELARYARDIKAFVAEVQPKYSSHVVDALLEWFVNFRSDATATFASKRGINFFGRKSSLRALFFLLMYQDRQLVAFAPLFKFDVDFGDGAGSYEVVSFCPDSTLFFYSDILIKSGCEESALQSFFDFLRQYNKANPYILLLNHIPSNSNSLALLTKYSMDLPTHGFKVSLSPVLWRGGLYPWNLASLKDALKDAAGKELPETTITRINEAMDLVSSANKTMMVFKRNHLSLKSAIYRIFDDPKPCNALFDLYNEVESIFQSCPVKYPYLALPESGEELADSLSPSKRYYYKRYRKQFLAKEGNFLKLTAEAIADQDIHDFISLHRERWGNSSNILNKMTASFLFSFLKTLALNGFLTLFFAVHQSERIACLCCLDFPGRREFFSSGRSLQAEKLRAGKLLLHESIMDSIEAGQGQFDFGYGDEAYKSDYNWSYLTNNVVALFHELNPKQFPNIFSVYEEVHL